MHSVDLVCLQPGCTVALLRAGPIGLLIAAMARPSGASEVYLTEPLAYRREFALDYVGGVALDPYPTADSDYSNVVDEIVHLTDGRGVDVASEAAGAQETHDQCIGVVCRGGIVVLCGIPSEDTMTLTPSAARHRGLTFKMVRRMKHTHPRSIRMVSNGSIQVGSLAAHLFPLERIDDAFQMVANYDDGVIRAVIQVAEEPNV